MEENLGDQEDQIIDLKSLENKNSYYKLLIVIWIVFASLFCLLFWFNFYSTFIKSEKKIEMLFPK